MRKSIVIAGKKVDIVEGNIHRGRYREALLKDLVGKKIEAIGHTTSDGPYGDEPCTVLFFTDGTQHGFVHPAECE
jgi:hypothetical protein